MTAKEAVCPLCGDYTGKPESVEAHITGKSDETHKGRFGAEFRNEIRDGEATPEASPERSPSPSPSDGVTEPEQEAGEDTETEPATGLVKVEDKDSDDEGMGALALLFLIGAVIWFVARNQRTPRESEFEALTGTGYDPAR